MSVGSGECGHWGCFLLALRLRATQKTKRLYASIVELKRKPCQTSYGCRKVQKSQEEVKGPGTHKSKIMSGDYMTWGSTWQWC